MITVFLYFSFQILYFNSNYRCTMSDFHCHSHISTVQWKARVGWDVWEVRTEEQPEPSTYPVLSPESERRERERERAAAEVSHSVPLSLSRTVRGPSQTNMWRSEVTTDQTSSSAATFQILNLIMSRLLDNMLPGRFHLLSPDRILKLFRGEILIKQTNIRNLIVQQVNR